MTCLSGLDTDRRVQLVYPRVQFSITLHASAVGLLLLLAEVLVRACQRCSTIRPHPSRPPAMDHCALTATALCSKCEPIHDEWSRNQTTP